MIEHGKSGEALFMFKLENRIFNLTEIQDVRKALSSSGEQ